MHPLEVCPVEGLKEPEEQFMQLERVVEAGRLLYVPRGHAVHCRAPAASA